MLTSRRVPIVAAGDPGWDEARTPWQLAVDQRPAAVALPRNAHDVAAVVRHARENGLRIAPQASGHNAGPLGSLERSLLVRTSLLTDMRIDPGWRLARVGAGVLWDTVMAAAAEHGLAGLAGSSPDVGVVGYSLGGGIGWLARRHGLQTNRITAVELVTPDGELVSADEDHEQDLFWALRGGGGNFGVVTSLEFELLDVTSVYAGVLAWDWRDAGPVLLRWSQWAATAPETITTAARIAQFPAVAEVPQPLRGRRLVMVDGAFLGSAEEAAPVLEPLRRMRPELDTFARMSPAGLVTVHGDPQAPTPVVSDHRMLSDLPREAVDAFVATAGPGSGSPLIIAELRQLGGALARRPERHGALPTLDSPFSLFAAGSPDEGVLEHARRVSDALAPWGDGRTYLNMAEQPIDVSTAFGEQEYRRLQAIRSRVDPDGAMHANHPIGG